MHIELIGFLLKKIFGSVLSPLPVCYGVILAGLFVLWFGRKKKLGITLVSTGLLVLVLFSYPAFSNLLLRPLENKYSPLNNLQNLKETKWIVVLGSAHNPDPDLPVSSRVSPDGLVRLAEGIRIHRQLAGSKLILSGGCNIKDKSVADSFVEVAEALGIDKSRMVLESLSRDTEDEARFIEKIVGQDRFILVTSASHMPRSIALFEKRGMKPLPAPTDYHAKKIRWHPAALFPSSNGLQHAEMAMHEYLGIVWSRLRGQI